jgi:hypothetical protein
MMLMALVDEEGACRASWLGRQQQEQLPSQHWWLFPSLAA